MFASGRLSQVNIFRHENGGKQIAVLSGIVHDSGGVEYSP